MTTKITVEEALKLIHPFWFSPLYPDPTAGDGVVCRYIHDDADLLTYGAAELDRRARVEEEGGPDVGSSLSNGIPRDDHGESECIRCQAARAARAILEAGGSKTKKKAIAAAYEELKGLVEKDPRGQARRIVKILIANKSA